MYVLPRRHSKYNLRNPNPEKKSVLPTTLPEQNYSALKTPRLTSIYSKGLSHSSKKLRSPKRGIFTREISQPMIRPKQCS
jgi:hypothetical protein